VAWLLSVSRTTSAFGCGARIFLRGTCDGFRFLGWRRSVMGGREKPAGPRRLTLHDPRPCPRKHDTRCARARRIQRCVCLPRLHYSLRTHSHLPLSLPCCPSNSLPSYPHPWWGETDCTLCPYTPSCEAVIVFASPHAGVLGLGRASGWADEMGWGHADRFVVGSPPPCSCVHARQPLADVITPLTPMPTYLHALHPRCAGPVGCWVNWADWGLLFSKRIR
jgi:hypothetical protein